jgi:hypothetical protein
MAEEAATIPSKTLAEFLASSPPDSTEDLSDLFESFDRPHAQVGDLNSPDIFLYCEKCQGWRYFEHVTGSVRAIDRKCWNTVFLFYRCRNCRHASRTFAVALLWTGGATGKALKLGEDPPFGPHTPPRVISLIGPDKELYLQGRRSESRGLGIGAFSYYRRVVENQKGRIIQEIANVAKKLGAKPEVLKRFEAAAEETQFGKAIEEIKDGIPPVLLIDGHHNPLTLLHSALSEGLHADTDAECLEIAKDIRLVLTDLADRLSQALKEHAELKNAVTRLLIRKSRATTTAPKETGQKSSGT